jgi:hypothetical protein
VQLKKYKLAGDNYIGGDLVLHLGLLSKAFRVDCHTDVWLGSCPSIVV